MKLFRGLPIPVNDETFTSWVYRCSVARNISVPGLAELSVTAKKSIGFIVVHEDPDFDRMSIFFGRACRFLQIDAEQAWAYFKPTSQNCAPWERRFYCCRYCINQDIVDGRLPSWRRSWCYEDSVFCHEHRAELYQGVSFSTLDKAWKAFSELVEFPYVDERWSDVRFSRLRYLLCQRIRIWQQILRFSSSPEARGSLSLYSAIYMTSLQVPTSRFTPGVARKFFDDARTRNRPDTLCFKDTLFKGPGDSSPRERYAATFISAFLVGLIPQAYLSCLERGFLKVRVDLRIDPFYFGKMFLDVYTDEECVVIRELFEEVNRPKDSAADRFLKGLEVNMSFSRPGSIS